MSNIRTRNVSSYGIGKKPYNPDVERGKWLSKWDFLFASFGHAFEIRNFLIYPFLMITHGGFFGFLPYVLSIFFFSIPIFFVQSFLGQFSSTGFISVFRVSPLFKGLSYTILVINLIISSYFVMITSIPLMYMISSFHPIIPWISCKNTDQHCVGIFDFGGNDKLLLAKSYFASITHAYNFQFLISVKISLALAFIWILIGIIVVRGVEFIGKIIRYMVATLLLCLTIILIRLLFTKGIWNGILLFFEPKFPDLMMWIIGPMIALTTFGSGWGITSTLASYNNFHEDIEKYSIIINFGHMILLIIGGIMSSIIYTSLNINNTDLYYLFKENPVGFVYIINGYFFGTLELPNFWCLLFFTMVFCCELVTCILQVFTITTAIFDEFEHIRIYKMGFTFGLTGFFALGSIIFYLGVKFRSASLLMSSPAIFTYFICFTELMIISWIYGKEKFFKDIEFLLMRPYSNWKFIILRYVAPLILLYAFAMIIRHIYFLIKYQENEPLLYWPSFIVSAVTIIMILIYLGYRIKNGSGNNILEKIKFLSRSIDWYPVDPDIRSEYELSVNKNFEMEYRLMTDNEPGNEVNINM